MNNNLTIGVMQPYFFPYIGYFQLIKSVDTYVNLDHVSFMKRSYMVRNKLKNDTQINVSVSNGSQNKKCTEVNVLVNEDWFDKFEQKLFYLYKKEKYYKDIIKDIIRPWRDEILSMGNNVNISVFNFTSIKYICDYLNIKCDFISTSHGLTDRKRNEGLQDIVKYFNGESYVNAIGGQKLYNKEDFTLSGINLKFIKMGDLDLDNPYSSILDILFRYSKDHVINELNKYTLI
jgi:hypothetical protein